MNKIQQPVVITGIGIVSAAGTGIPAFRQALFEGNSLFKTYQIPPLSFPVVAACIPETPIQLDPLLTLSHNTVQVRQQYLKKMFRKLLRPHQLSLIATLEAWQSAQMDMKQVDSTRIGMVVATQNNSLHYQYNCHDEFVAQPEYLSPVYALNYMDTHHLGVVSDVFAIQGEGFTVGGASASGNIALLRAFQLIQQGGQDACLVLGSMADLSPMELQGFANVGALGGHHYADNPKKASRPFDKESEGFIYGQATVCMILESIDSVKQRHAPILGYLVGGAVVLDGNYLSNPNQEGEARVMRQAMASSNLLQDDIEYINTHGSSSPLGDKVEVAAIEETFGKKVSAIPLNSTKSIIGHCLCSAGIVEAIATVIQLQEGFLHPSLNLDSPISDKCNFVRGESQRRSINTALSNSFGFDGINSAIIIQKNIKVC